jgi:hypothetical protein
MTGSVVPDGHLDQLRRVVLAGYQHCGEYVTDRYGRVFGNETAATRSGSSISTTVPGGMAGRAYRKLREEAGDGGLLEVDAAKSIVASGATSRKAPSEQRCSSRFDGGTYSVSHSASARCSSPYGDRRRRRQGATTDDGDTPTLPAAVERTNAVLTGRRQDA